jgi:hypothetical protein
VEIIADYCIVPAIIVGTTGVAMAAHAQTFAFQGKLLGDSSPSKC